MKYLKLSKTSWLILAVGLFVVVMAALGITRSQQAQEQGRLTDELEASQMSLAGLKIADLQTQLEQLQQQVDKAQLQFDEAQKQLDQTVVSVDVTDKFFSIASNCGVKVINLGTSPIVPSIYEGIGLSITSINAVVEGELAALIDFVESLNRDFTTGLIKSALIDIPPSSSDETPSANIQIIIYSYEGNDNG
jgi:predicted PurR-regulated permease PerM